MDHVELLQAQAHIWNHMFNYLKTMSLKCAINLGIPDVIHKHGKPMKLSDLTSALPIHPTKSHGVYRLMHVLIHSGYFATQKLSENDKKEEEEEEEEEGYVLTPTSHLLLKDNPMSLTPFVLSTLDPVLTEPWHDMSDWFQNDVATLFRTRHGVEFWEFCANQPKFNNLFNDSMASDARFVSSILLQHNKQAFEGLTSLVDVGGGTGTLAMAIAKEFPDLDCTVFDLPHVVDGLKGNENLKYVAGDMFDQIPPADAILLKSILHDWSDEDCMKILKNCKEAMAHKKEGGKVIIIDMVVMEEENRKGDDDEGSIETQVLSDMAMAIEVKGQERKEKQWAKLFLDSGFTSYKIMPVLGLRSVIEAYP